MVSIPVLLKKGSKGMVQTYPTWAYTAVQEESLTYAGGLPTLSAGQWPRTVDGNPYRFLFQLDLSSVPDLGLNLPTTGLLQFWHAPDDLYGMDLDVTPGESTRRGTLVLHITEDLSQAEEFPTDYNHPGCDYSPLENPLQKIFYKGTLTSMTPFPNTLEAKEAEEGREAQETLLEDAYGSDYEFYNSEEEEAQELAPEEYEFHLGGVPAFTQGDFRQNQDFVLLLGSESGPNLMWGDMGVAGFWLTGEAVDTRQYNEAFLYWDCF